MDVYRTEEEQIAALKRWWGENGTSILVGLVLAVGAVLGWQGWQTHQQESGEAASKLYFELLEAVELSVDDETGAQAGNITHLVSELKAEYESSAYAQYAALFAAKQAVLSDDLAVAEAELQWVVDNSDTDSSMHLIATLRLARVIAAQDEAERALDLIESVDAGSHMASYEEIKGDLYLALGRTDEARNAYQLAVDEVNRTGGRKPVLTMKLNDLATGSDS